MDNVRGQVRASFVIEHDGFRLESAAGNFLNGRH